MEVSKHSVNPSGPPVVLTLLSSLSGTACLVISEAYQISVFTLCQDLLESAVVP